MFVLRYLPRFQRAYRDFETLAERETWSSVRIADFQLLRLNELWAHSIRHVPYYRTLSRQRRLPSEFSSLQEFQAEIPELAKQEVNAHPYLFLSERCGRGCWRRTSGSTGTPTKFFSGHEAHREMLRAKYRAHAMWGVDIFARTVFLWGHFAAGKTGWQRTKARLTQSLEDQLRNRLRLSAFQLHPEKLNSYLQHIQRFRPERIYAYSNAVYLLACQSEATGTTCESLKLITMSAEPAQPRMIRTVERAFNVPAVIEYGATECGMIACEWPDRTLRVREDIVLVETVPQSDRGYRLLITVLNNPSFPLIRYAIGDVTDATLRHPERGFAILGNLVGRDNELLIARSGRCLHGIEAEKIFEAQHCDTVRRFFIHQQHDGSLRVQVELRHAQVPFDRRRLIRQLSACVDGYPVDVNVVKSINTARAGKNQTVISDLAQSRELKPDQPGEGGT